MNFSYCSMTELTPHCKALLLVFFIQPCLKYKAFEFKIQF
uniref:Uncharacterized protein n=1 Tax=Anguilla anguilla TaxID=7936 RepID=A0A0E9TTH7_ANGAN